MEYLYIIGIILVTIFILYRTKVGNDKIRLLQDEINLLKVSQIPSNVHVKEKKVLPDSGFTYKKHMVIVNSDENVTQIDLPHKLKNVVHAELISGIMPKSQSRINQFNNSFAYLGNLYQVEQGSYSDIISLLMLINQQVHDSNPAFPLYFTFDALHRKIVACADVNDVGHAPTPADVIDFSVPNSIGHVLGFDDEKIPISQFTDTFQQNVLNSSLNYFYDLRSKSQLNNKAINNFPPSVYTYIDEFVLPDGSINQLATASWTFKTGQSRVNMKHQLYVDVELDEVQYWDGTNRLARVFIPESLDETEYTSYNNPIRRSLREDFINLDKLTVRLKSVVSENKKHDYDLQGLNYSLQIELTTVDKLLTSSHTILRQ